MSKRNILRIELTGTAKQNVGKLSDHYGMTQLAMASRLVEWFAAQDPMMQAAVLGFYPSEVKPDMLKMVLERMAKRE